jgi:hypothetical protein
MTHDEAVKAAYDYAMRVTGDEDLADAVADSVGGLLYTMYPNDTDVPPEAIDRLKRETTLAHSMP